MSLPHEYVYYLKLINSERSLAISNLYFRPFSTFLSSDWIFSQKYLSNGDVLLSYRILFSKKGTLGVLSVMSVKQKAEVGSRSKCKVLIDLRKGLSNMESPRTWSQRGQKKGKEVHCLRKISMKDWVEISDEAAMKPMVSDAGSAFGVFEPTLFLAQKRQKCKVLCCVSLNHWMCLMARKWRRWFASQFHLSLSLSLTL